MTVRIRIAAERDLEAAFEWYLSHQPSAAAAFLDRYMEALQRIAEAPERWPAHPYVPEMKRVRLDLFPYSLVYSLRHGQCTIYAVEDLRRKPGYWKRRRR
jgi:plasmid stabilization system protein ParE